MTNTNAGAGDTSDTLPGAVLPPGYQPDTDRYSQRLFDEARRLARTPGLDADARQAALAQMARALDEQLARDHAAGLISQAQYDGGPYILDDVGGERGEIAQAARILQPILARPDAARILGRRSLLFTSDLFYNTTFTGETGDGRMVHLRFGTHGDLALRARAPAADGFPYRASKWVEGSLVVGNRMFAFVDLYTHSFRVDVDGDGVPVALRFRGLVTTQAVTVDVLSPGPDKWTAGRPASPSTGRALVAFHIPVTAAGARAKTYGLAGMGFVDRNFALEASGGSIDITTALTGDMAGPEQGAPPADETGPHERIELGAGFGALEEGQFRNLPERLPPAYSYAQGQRLDTVRLLAEALRTAPAPLVSLFPAGPLRDALDAVLAGAPPPADLAARLDADLRARARRDTRLRRAAAPILLAHLGPSLLPAPADRAVSLRFEGRLLSRSLPARLASIAIGALMDEAGRLHPSGAFESYETGFMDILRRNPDLVDPVAMLANNHVLLWRAVGSGFRRHLVERRTVLLFDTRAAAFLLGFQEVFHARATLAP